MVEDKVIVIMLGYQSLAGKDTFYSFAEKYNYQRVAFADKLKEVVGDLYGFNHDQMHGNTKDIVDVRYPNTIDHEDADGYLKYFTPRRILQVFGQQQRALFPTIWSSYVFNNKIPKMVNEGFRKFVITDFRFPNEYEVARQWEQKSSNNILLPVKVNRNIHAKSGAFDVSEHALDDFSFWSDELNNYSSLQDYEIIVHRYLDYVEHTILERQIIA